MRCLRAQPLPTFMAFFLINHLKLFPSSQQTDCMESRVIQEPLLVFHSRSISTIIGIQFRPIRIHCDKLTGDMSYKREHVLYYKLVLLKGFYIVIVFLR